MTLLVDGNFKLESERFPELLKWKSSMEFNEVVKKFFIPTEYHFNFISKYALKDPNNAPDYDVLS